MPKPILPKKKAQNHQSKPWGCKMVGGVGKSNTLGIQRAVREQEHEIEIVSSTLKESKVQSAEKAGERSLPERRRLHEWVNGYTVSPEESEKNLNSCHFILKLTWHSGFSS